MNYKKSYLLFFVMQAGLLLLFSKCNWHLFGNKYPYTKTINNKLEEADLYFKAKSYENALTIYEDQLDKIDPVPEIFLKLGVCYYKSEKSSNKAEHYLKKAAEAHETKAHYHLGKLYRTRHQFDKAIDHFVMFKNTLNPDNINKHDIDHQINKCFTARKLVNEPEDITIKNMGENINSAYDDYVPVISTDESKLLFTSRRKGSTGGLKDITDKYYEDIYISYKEDGKWTAAENTGKPINTKWHDATVALSADGRKLLIYRASFQNITGEIYQSVLNDNKWSEPEKLSSNINSEYNEPSASIGSSEKVIYFSSDRPGGFGGKDIYKANKLPTGKWGPAINLGPVINTRYDEDAPFIHPDNQSLFFSSEGHRNMGGYDIFVSRKDSGGNWSIPENMGYPINTTKDDIYLLLSADGKTGYYASDKDGGYGNKDIYKINFQEDKIPVTVVKGFVQDAQTKEKLKSTITVMDINEKVVHGIYASSGSGKYLMVLNPDKQYKFIIEAKGYKSYIDTITIKAKNDLHEVKKNILMTPAEQ